MSNRNIVIVTVFGLFHFVSALNTVAATSTRTSLASALASTVETTSDRPTKRPTGHPLVGHKKISLLKWKQF